MEKNRLKIVHRNPAKKRGEINSPHAIFNKKNNNQGKGFSKEIGASFISTGAKPKKLDYSSVEIFVRKNVNGVISGAEWGLNFAKEMGINPYIQEQINTIKMLYGDVIERDKNRAAATGGLLTPRLLLGMTTITNYPRTWIDKTAHALAPNTTEAIFNTRQKVNNVFISPFTKVWKKGKRISRDLERKFYSPQEYKKIQVTRKKKRADFTAKTSGRVDKLEGLINKKIKVPKLKMYPAA